MADSRRSELPPPIPPPVNPDSKSEPEDANFDVSANLIPKDIRKTLNLPPMFNTNQMAWNASFNPNLLRNYPQYPPGSSVPSYFGATSNYPSSSMYNQWNGTNFRRNLQYDAATNGFISRLAEEKTRPTFSSIEMILDAFSSINFILESTYSAIHGSFKTITGVADHLIFVRNHLTQIALFSQFGRIIYQFFRWILKCFGLDKLEKFERFSEEKIWSEAVANQDSIKRMLDDSCEKQSSSWPVLAFLSMVLGTPYIIWKLLGAPGSLPKNNLPNWTLKTGRHFVAIGLYDFKARNSDELSFQKNQMLFVKPESLQPGSKWLIACTMNDNTKLGFIPLNYVKLIMK